MHQLKNNHRNTARKGQKIIIEIMSFEAFSKNGPVLVIRNI